MLFFLLHPHENQSQIGLFKVNLEWPFLGLKFENFEIEISGWVRNWELKTWVLKPRSENPDSWLLSKYNELWPVSHLKWPKIDTLNNLAFGKSQKILSKMPK